MPESFALTCRGFRFITLGLFIMKKERHTYESYCRAFAGIYNKHSKRSGNYYTCYVRAAIEFYIRQDETERGVIMETAARESLVGYKIAHSLLQAGWSEDAIIEYTAIQQSRVDVAESLVSFEEAIADLYESRPRSSYASTMNYMRYLWLLDGAPDLEDVCQDILDAEESYSSDAEEDYHDDEE